MSNFTDYISTLPLNVLNNTLINERRIVLPTVVAPQDLYSKCQETIVAPTLSPEKALYLFLRSQSV